MRHLNQRSAFLAYCDGDWYNAQQWPHAIRSLLGKPNLNNQERFKAFCFFYGNGLQPGRIRQFMYSYPQDPAAVRQFEWLFKNVKTSWRYWDIGHRRSLYMTGKSVIPEKKNSIVGKRFLTPTDKLPLKGYFWDPRLQ